MIQNGHRETDMRRYHVRWAMLCCAGLLAAIGAVVLGLHLNRTLAQEQPAGPLAHADREDSKRDTQGSTGMASVSSDQRPSGLRSSLPPVASRIDVGTERKEGMRDQEPMAMKSRTDLRATKRAAGQQRSVNQTPLQESRKAESASLRTGVVLAVPWGDQAGQLGRSATPDPVHDEFPADFCVGPDGVLWVCDLVNDRVVGYRIDPEGKQLPKPLAQVQLDRPTHVAATKQGLFILDWPRRDGPEKPLQFRLLRYADGRLQEVATFQDIAAGYPSGQLIALAGGDLLVVGDHLHRVTLDGEVQEVPIEAEGISVVISPASRAYQASKWEWEGGILRGTVRQWTLEPEVKEQAPLEVALSYDTGPDVDPERLSKGYPRGALLIGADGAGRLYVLLHELLKEGKLRLTLARFSPSGELLARGFFQPAGVDLRKAWARCSNVFWRVTADGRVLVPIPTEQEYRLLEASFGPGS